jgi:ABC-type transport system involved in multi-copper enzyme maturation permease subunit
MKFDSRVGLGPVFVYEWITSARRWQVYAMRSLFVTALLLALACVWINMDRASYGSAIIFLASLGERFFVGAIGVQLALVVLLAPAMTAGAISIDRARGTLLHILVTDLSAAEIVLGKLAVRLTQVLGVLACTFPVLQIISLLGGVDPNALLCALVVAVGLAVLCCSLGLTFSLWARKTHEAVLLSYSVLFLWMLAEPIFGLLGSTLGWSWLQFPKYLDPIFLAFAPYWSPGRVVWVDYIWFLALTCSISVALAGKAMLEIRSVCTSDRGSYGRRSSRSVRGNGMLSFMIRNIPWLTPSLDGNPVVWLEWRRSRPGRRAIWLTIAYAGLAVFFSVVSVVWSRALAVSFLNGVLVSIGLLVLGLLAATSLVDEQGGRSLELLLSTPLSTRRILVGKWLGVLRKAPSVAILPTFLIAANALVSNGAIGWGPLRLFMFVLCAGGAVAGVGLAMATRLSRPGWAVGGVVWVWVLLTILWPGLAVFVMGPGAGKLVMGSPFLWAAIASGSQPRGFHHPVSWELFWIVFYGLAGVGLLLSTMRGFERRLNRVDERAVRLCLPSRTLECVTAFYFCWGLSFTFLLFLSPPDSSLPPIGAGLLFSTGLLLLAVRASSPLAKQAMQEGARYRAGDRKFASRVFFAKWTVAAGVLPWVALLPLSVAFYAYAASSVDWARFLVLFSFILVACLFVVSLGAAMFAWCRGGAWAAIMMVMLWGLMTTLWIAAGRAGFRHHFYHAHTSRDPFFDVVSLVLWMNEISASEIRPLAGMIGASVVYGAGGGLVRLVTLPRFGSANRSWSWLAGARGTARRDARSSLCFGALQQPSGFTFAAAIPVRPREGET